MEALRSHFSRSENIISPIVRASLYDDQIRRGRLRIDTALRIRPEEAEEYPAVLVSRGEWSAAPRGLNNMQVSANQWDYFTVWKGSHNIICASTVLSEAEELAYETARFLVAFSKPIADRCGLGSFFVAGIGAPQIDSQRYEVVFVPVSVVYTVEEVIRLTQEMPEEP